MLGIVIEARLIRIVDILTEFPFSDLNNLFMLIINGDKLLLPFQYTEGFPVRLVDVRSVIKRFWVVSGMVSDSFFF